MRKTGPVTQKEVEIKPGEELISATDPKSRITHCNEVFVRISGYSEAELIGESHNLLRHPDMPQEAFRMMWDRIQNGRPWMGLVKNRCKNGDHYWVDAYVMPVWEGDTIVGYESVRVHAPKEMKARAEILYARLNAGKKAFTWREHLRAWKVFTGVGALMALVVLGLVNITGFGAMNLWSQLVTAGLTGLAVTYVIPTLLRKRLDFLHEVINDPVAQYVYTGDIGILGAVRLALFAQQHHTSTVLGRMGGLARDLSASTEDTSERLTHVVDRVKEQRTDTDTMASAVHEMSATIRDVAENSRSTAGETARVTQQVRDGNGVLQNAVSKINALNSEVRRANEVVSKLATDSGDIKAAVDSIGAIAEQTNLLALNAAIEAARAGEQGRGFAVVADEVRNLAQRTQESTVSIADLLNHLVGATADAVTAIETSHEEAEAGVAAINELSEKMEDILRGIGDIERGTENISEAVSQQELASSEMAESTNRIAERAEANQGDMDQGAALVDNIRRMAAEQASLIDRFSR
ncbi:MAG: methyl-accepting chemotaxis protein [Natronospirillum sp.]|uniref:methyl-accepting chemotaxis protein n=1 Tax=Natronospirillum sp. TaxID=2812955 RepID=UPI0025FA445A|nr:PAS domain-containing methyl-accepting chemotaxis protein [Natronospirillum sp.]MCH8550985.1 methyl-accepting chemotaxis protein [Natronospirillum sp.]